MKLPKTIRKLLGQDEAKIKRPSQAFDALTPEDKLKVLTETIVFYENLKAVGLDIVNYSEEIRFYSNEVRRIIQKEF